MFHALLHISGYVPSGSQVELRTYLGKISKQYAELLGTLLHESLLAALLESEYPLLAPSDAAEYIAKSLKLLFEMDADTTAYLGVAVRSILRRETDGDAALNSVQNDYYNAVRKTNVHVRNDRWGRKGKSPLQRFEETTSAIREDSSSNR